MSNYFTAPDGADEPTIWEHGDVRREPKCIVRKAELPGPYADLLWSVLVGVLTADEETVEHVAKTMYENTWSSDWPDDDEEYRDSYRKDARAVLTALSEGR